MKQIIFSVLAVVLLSACTKDASKDLGTVEEQNLPLFNQVQVDAERGEAIRAKIKQFRKRMEDASQGVVTKNNTQPLSVEEAMWNIEALLNSAYANASIPFKEKVLQTSQIVIPTENGYITDIDLLNGVLAASTKLAEHYNNVQSSYVHPIVVDIEVDNETEGEVTVSVSSVMTSEPPQEDLNNIQPIGGCNIFNANDQWHWGFAQGRCDGSGTAQGLDAADVLTVKLNQRIPDPANTLYFTDVQVESLYASMFPNPNDPTLDNYRDYLMFDCHSSAIAQYGCLSQSDMSFYYCSMYDVLNQVIPSGKSFIEITVYDDFVTPITGTSYQHLAILYYGEAVLCPCPPCYLGGGSGSGPNPILCNAQCC